MRTAILLCSLCLLGATAQAGRHTVQRGETLEHVARTHGCSVDALLHANKLNTTLVKPGTVVEIPACTLRAKTRSITSRARARTREPRGRAPESDDPEDRARFALAVVDGATLIAEYDDPSPPPAPSESVGEPWDGHLRNATKLPDGDGYQIRRPARAWGASHVIDHLTSAIASVRAMYPDVHTLAIGDLSAQRGGKIGDHNSHQTGLDVDLGFYFRRVPEGYPQYFCEGDDDLDLAATWALITAFARTEDLPDGVQVIFLDRDIQRRLHRWAKKRGTPIEQLEHLMQYPRESDSLAGLVRHWPNHTNHMHVRFKPGR